jgi:hypothetical protein
MSAIINVSLNLDNLNKSKVIKGKKGNYYNITLSLNDQTSQFGDNVSMFDTQTKEERESKADRNYVGNGKVVWTDGTVVAAERQDAPQSKSQPVAEDVDFPF